MKNFYKVLLAVILLPSLSLAQSNYKSGYVVTSKGDTLRGFIDYREWDKNPDAISFKTALADTKARQFTPEQARFIKINGQEAYQHYAGPISMDVTDKDHLGYQRDTSSRVASVFFRVLQKGKNLSLYSYTDNLKSRFYVGEAPDYRPKELGYRMYYNYGTETANQQKGVTVNENTYMKQLFALANKYEVLNSNLQWDIEHANYNSDDLLQIVSKINHISKEETRKTEALKGPAFNLFVGAGVNIDHISVASPSPYYNAGGRSVTSSLPEGSFGINFFANRSTRQLQFRLELGVTKSQYKSLYDSKVEPYIPFRASYDELILSVTPQIIYNFYNTENFKVYAGVGVSLTSNKFSNAYLGSQSQPNSAYDIQANNPYLFISSDNRFMANAGIQFNKHIGVFFQYLTSVNISRDAYWGLTSIRQQIGLNYFFN